MITVKGVKVDVSGTEAYEKPFFEEYENIGQFLAKVKRECYGKSSIKFPPRKEDWSFDEENAETHTKEGFPGYFSYKNAKDGEVYTRVYLITDDDEKVLFSSGELTKGHISSATREAFRMLYEWKNAGYEFAD